jgi:hypothetical protein
MQLPNCNPGQSMRIPRAREAQRGQRQSGLLWAAAERSSVSAETLAGILTIEAWEDARDSFTRELLGHPEQAVNLWSRLCRECVVCLAHGKQHGIAHYQRMFIHLASDSATREEIFRLAEIGVLIILPDETNVRRTIVLPTARLTLWYAKVTLLLVEEGRILFRE